MPWPTTLATFMRTLAMPKTAEPWSLTSLREKLIKIGAKVVSHGRYVTFQMAEVAVPRQDVPGNPVADRPAAGTARAGMTNAGGRCNRRHQPKCAPMRTQQHVSAPRRGQLAVLTACCAHGARFAVAQDARRDDPGLATARNLGNVG